jgi:glycerophosphoryl diester phosphodiesterase
MMKRPNNPYARIEKPHVIAHRGGAGMAPENTLLAFEQAAKLPIDALEMDIHLSADGVLIVSHDETVDRSTEGTGLIKSKTLAELRALDFGYRFEDEHGDFPFRGSGLGLPTLADIFERFPDRILNIDIKQHEPLVVEKLVQMIERFGMQDNVIVGSFDTETIRYFRRLIPSVGTAGSQREVGTFFALHKLGLTRLWRHDCVAFQIPETAFGLQIVTLRFVRTLRSRGVMLHVWTVNESADMRRLLAFGVDGLITDFPVRLLELLGQNQE